MDEQNKIMLNELIMYYNNNINSAHSNNTQTLMNKQIIISDHLINNNLFIGKDKQKIDETYDLIQSNNSFDKHTYN